MALGLEEALALLGGSPGGSTELHQSPLPYYIANRESDMHRGILDDDIGELEASVITTQPSPNSATNCQLAMKKKRKKINPNKARDERRFQLIELQEQVAELEFTLNRMQTLKNKRPKTLAYPDCKDEIPRVWQEICARQLDRRLEAERENIRLQKQYEKEKQLVQSFEKLLYKGRTLRSPELGTTKRTRRTDIPEGHVERMAALIVKELAAGVKVCYDKVGYVFESKRPVPMDLVGHSTLLDKGKQLKGTERKFYDRRTIPFNMHATGDAWWENWHNYRGQRFQDIAADEIIEAFGLEMSDFKTNTSATAYAQQVSRRYIEDGRIVVVWDSYVEPFGFANERIGGVYFMEQTYVLIEPEDWSSERACGGSTGCSTRISTCYVITPHFLDPKLKGNPTTTAVINFLVSALSSNIMALSEMVETVLLDQVLQRSITELILLSLQDDTNKKSLDDWQHKQSVACCV